MPVISYLSRLISGSCSKFELLVDRQVLPSCMGSGVGPKDSLRKGSLIHWETHHPLGQSLSAPSGPSWAPALQAKHSLRLWNQWNLRKKALKKSWSDGGRHRAIRHLTTLIQSQGKVQHPPHSLLPGLLQAVGDSSSSEGPSATTYHVTVNRTLTSLALSFLACEMRGSTEKIWSLYSKETKCLGTKSCVMVEWDHGWK